MDLETVFKELESIKHTVETISSNQERDHTMLVEHDKILVRGNGVPSLQETVRMLSKTVEEFVAEAKKREDERKEDARKWKWAVIGIGLPAIAAFTWQAVVFWVRVAPAVELILGGMK